jgi:hypothetical protein
MPKRSSKKAPRDINVLAASIVEEATKAGKDPLAVELGRRGGLKGGVARAKKLTPEQRQEIARNAARARWQKKNE